MPALTNIPNTQSISFGQIATYAGASLVNVSLVSLAIIYTGVDDVAPIAICEFYSNGCAGAIPPIPTGMSATLSSGLTFNLSWNASSGATSYKVYRGGVYNKTVTGTSTTGLGIAYSTQYCWTVTAVNTNGESDPSTQSCAPTASGPALNPVEYLYGTNATVACDFASEADIFYVDAPYILDVTKIYTDAAGTIYAPSNYYSSAGDGVWIRWSSGGVILDSGVCDNPV